MNSPTTPTPTTPTDAQATPTRTPEAADITALATGDQANANSEQQETSNSNNSSNNNNNNNNNDQQVQISADYLAQLIKDKKQLAAFPSVFIHVQRLIDDEINKVRQSLFQLSDVVHQLEPLDLPEPEGEFVQLQEKLYVPVDEHPEYNFVGRLLGPRGMTAKQLEQETGCKIMIRGRGSMRDKKKEEQNRGKANWEHLNDELHVLITVEDTQNRAQLKMDRALEEVKQLLVPIVDGEDELKKRQLMELAIINGTYQRHYNGAGNSQNYTSANINGSSLSSGVPSTGSNTPNSVYGLPAQQPVSSKSHRAHKQQANQHKQQHHLINAPPPAVTTNAHHLQQQHQQQQHQQHQQQQQQIQQHSHIPQSTGPPRQQHAPHHQPMANHSHLSHLHHPHLHHQPHPHPHPHQSSAVAAAAAAAAAALMANPADTSALLYAQQYHDFHYAALAAAAAAAQQQQQQHLLGPPPDYHAPQQQAHPHPQSAAAAVAAAQAIAAANQQIQQQQHYQHQIESEQHQAALAAYNQQQQQQVQHQHQQHIIESSDGSSGDTVQINGNDNTRNDSTEPEEPMLKVNEFACSRQSQEQQQVASGQLTSADMCD